MIRVIEGVDLADDGEFIFQEWKVLYRTTPNGSFGTRNTVFSKEEAEQIAQEVADKYGWETKVVKGNRYTMRNGKKIKI